MTAQPGAGVTITSYGWYVNGEERGTNSSILLHTGDTPTWFELGVNSLTLVVTIGGVPYSEEFRFDVVPYGDIVSPNIGRLKAVPAGSFQRDATAANVTTLTQAFRMSRYEITRAQFDAVMGADPSDAEKSSGPGDPVQNVNWYHAIAFCHKLSLAEGLTPAYAVSGVDFAALTYGGIPTTDDDDWNAATVNAGATGYRLTTEAQWMWAAMGADTAEPETTNTTGHEKAFAGSNGSNAIGNYAWYNVNSDGKTHPVGTKLPNELGLYDTSGNVWEATWDWDAGYPDGPLTDPTGAASGGYRVTRGGSWSSAGAYYAVDYRSYASPIGRGGHQGFRVVRP